MKFGLAVWGVLLIWAAVMFIVQITGLILGLPGYVWFMPSVFFVLMGIFGIGYKITKDGAWG